MPPTVQRGELLDILAGEFFDVLVIGGGITGAGVALEAAARGYRVALVERADYASGTSRWSTKLVHGGIRYLPQFDLRLVHEALVERGRLLRGAPALVEPLFFLLPIYRENRSLLSVPRLPRSPRFRRVLLELGLSAYDLLAGRERIGRHRRIPEEELRRLAPRLRVEGLAGAFGYWDARVDDARLVLAVLATARGYGALTVNYCEVVGFERRSERLVAALVRDRIAGRAVTVRARVFVNATGVWGEALERLTGAPPAVQIAPSKGVHLVLPREKVGIREAAVVLPETDDQRLLFIVPFHDVVVIGTTDTIGSALGPPLVDDSDVEYLLTHANRYLLDPLARADVISAFAGYRPLIRRGAVESTARLSRSHVVIEHPHGMISILGGKLTTFRRMAEETVDRIDRRLGRKSRYPTRALRFAGRERLWDAALVVEQRAMELGVFESVPWLLQAYGSAATAILDLAAADPDLRRPIVPGLPYLLAEVVHACREEQAERLSDVLERRTWVLFADRRHGLGAVEEVSRIMARELGWSEDFRRKEVDRYRRRVQELCGSEDGIAESFAKTRLLGRRVDS